MLTLIGTVSETVKQSLMRFVENDLKSNPDTLSGGLISELSGGLEASLAEAAQAGLKAFLEQFDSNAEQIERDGRSYRLKEASSCKKFLTVFGEIEVARRYYHCSSGGTGIVPLDERWAMQGRYATPEVVEHVLWASALLVPGDLAQTCARMCRFVPSPSCIQDIIRRDAAAMATMLEAEPGGQACRGIEVPAQTEVFVASLDGANVLLREKGVKRGRPAQRPGLKQHYRKKGNANRADGIARAPDAQNPSSYKNAMVGSFSFYTRVDGIIDIESGAEGIVPERLRSIYCARMPEDNATGFKAEFEALLATIDKQISDEVTRIILIDGARPLWNYVENHALFKGCRLLLDFFHGSEHLSMAAEALFGKDNTKATSWYEKWRFKLKYEQGAVDGILRSIAHYQGKLRIPKGRRKDLEREIVFFQRNKARMNYHAHIANGWPIGSGPVEAACKTIVKARLCQSGMRWSRQGGRNILALRVLNRSNQWDQAWKQYRSQHWQASA